MRYERQEELYAILKEKGSATVAELAARIYTSEASVRRDIAALEERGLVEKVYGGVILATHKNGEMPVGIRDSANAKAKDEIAARAAELVRDDMTIIIDSSSTARRIVKHLVGKKGLRIITNNLSIFTDVSRLDAKIYCTGGVYNKNGNDFLGPRAEQFLSTVSADILFFSAQGLSECGEITDVSEERNSLRRVMLTRASRRVFLCDSSKLGVCRTFTLCTVDEVDSIISDADVNAFLQL